MTKNKKIVLVTGASRGLGRKLTKILSSSDSYKVYGTARNPENLPEYCIPLKLDLADEKTIFSALDTILTNEGKIDIVINNAGIAFYGPVDSMTFDELHKLFNINLFGVFKLVQYLLPSMRNQKQGKILFVSSIRGVESHAYMGAYSATKAALEAMAFDWAVTLTKWNIQVSVVQPGPLDTRIELRAGSYFSKTTDPYAPYAVFQVKCQSADEAAKVIVEKMTHDLPFRFQTSDDAKLVVEKHLIDAEGNTWLEEQKNTLSKK